jgi:hypothetical protein
MDLSFINAWIAVLLGSKMWLKHLAFLIQLFVDAISVEVGDGKQSRATLAH